MSLSACVSSSLGDDTYALADMLSVFRYDDDRRTFLAAFGFVEVLDDLFVQFLSVGDDAMVFLVLLGGMMICSTPVAMPV